MMSRIPFARTTPVWRHLAACLAVFTALALTGTPEAHAQTRVAALVNDQPISTFDVQQRARFIEVTGRIGGNRARQMALEELIEEELQLQEVRRLNIAIEEDRVNEALGGMASRVNMDLAGLSSAFSQMGVNMDTLRRRVRADVAWAALVRQQFRQEVQIREQDVLIALSELEGQGIATTTELNMQQIVFFTVRGTSSAEGRANADAFRSRFSGCDTTAALISEFPSAAFKNIGRLTLDDMDDEMRGIVESVPAGGTSNPVTTDEAVTVFAVCSRRDFEDDAVARREVEQELASEEGQRLSRRLLIEVRQRATIEYR